MSPREMDPGDLDGLIRRALEMERKRQHRAAQVGFGFGAMWAVSALADRDITPDGKRRLLAAARLFAERFMAQQDIETSLGIPMGAELLEDLDPGDDEDEPWIDDVGPYPSDPDDEDGT